MPKLPDGDEADRTEDNAALGPAAEGTIIGGIYLWFEAPSYVSRALATKQ